jgi:TfoX/Sxy family transcriptional regulator of competence genes
LTPSPAEGDDGGSNPRTTMPDKPAMPTFSKPPADLVERFTSVMAARPAALVRKMFGSPAAFVNGHMTTGLHAGNWFVRLSEADAAELSAAGGGPFEPMPGRPMRGYTLLPSVMADDPAMAGAWVDRAIDHVASLPPKN